METSPAILLTIVAESLLKDRLLAELRRAGARGWTVTEAEGEGSRHRRVGEILGENIRIETVVASETAQAVLARLADEYFPRFAVVAWTSSVHVVRGEKFV